MAIDLALSGIQSIRPSALGTASDSAASAAPTSGATQFAEVLRDMVSDAGNNLKTAENLSVQSLSGGEVNTREVVDAVMTAEQTLNTAIAIRDKIVTAYLEISRMQI